MKFFLGLIVGAAAAWYYRSTQPDMTAPQFMEHARDTVGNLAETGAQRAAEVIDRTPIPRRAKDAATSVAEAVKPVTEDSAEQTPNP
jgi:hypothetical protein